MKPCQPKIDQSTQKAGSKEQNGRPTSKKTNEPPKRANHTRGTSSS